MKQPNTSSKPTPDWSVYFGSTIYFLGIVLSTVFICPVMVMAWRLPFEIRYALAKVWVRTNLFTVKYFCGLDYQVQGLENIPRENGVILCKHQSAWETLAIQLIFPPLVFILKKELLHFPIWGWAMRTQNPIAIDRSARSAALKQVLRDGEARLREGRWVLIFPEGTRVVPGESSRYNGSGGLLAHRVGCPVVPVAHNAGSFWGRNAFLKYPGTIKVRIGPAIDSSKLTVAEINRQAEAWIEAQMLELQPEAGIVEKPVPA